MMINNVDKQMDKRMKKVIEDINKIKEIERKYDFIELEMAICNECLNIWINEQLGELNK